LSEPKNGSLDWRPEPVKIGQKFKNTPTFPLCDVSPGEPQSQIKKNFLIETRRLSASVEGLNSSLAIAAGELWPKVPATAVAGADVKGRLIKTDKDADDRPSICSGGVGHGPPDFWLAPCLSPPALCLISRSSSFA